MKVESIGEDALLQRMLTMLPEAGSEVLVGAGDDCAVIENGGENVVLLKTDAVVESVHFLADENPQRVGWKAVARVLSDMAAMGGWADHLLVTLAIDAQTEVEWVEQLYMGMTRCAQQHGCSIVGGETTQLPSGKMVSVSASGRVPREQLTLRSTAQAGDVVMVTGRLGGSIQGKHLDFQPRVQQGQWLAGKVHAMMDLSDGLAKDLPRLAAMSGLGYHVEKESLPCNPHCTAQQAACDGEDYELLLTVAAEAAEALLLDWKQKFPQLELTAIGTMQEGKGGNLTGGWEHFC